MSHNTRSDQNDANLRRTAIKRYRAGTPDAEVARQLRRSRSWVYKWVHYCAHHHWSRFRSAPRIPPIIRVCSTIFGSSHIPT
jgi:Homeodomain-like domain